MDAYGHDRDTAPTVTALAGEGVLFEDAIAQGMWTKVWLLLGRESELPNPGDWQMEPVGREEILMVRQQ